MTEKEDYIIIPWEPGIEKKANVEARKVNKSVKYSNGQHHWIKMI